MNHGVGLSAGDCRRTRHGVLLHGGDDSTTNPVSRLFDFCAAHKIPSPRFDFTVDWKDPLRPRHVVRCVVWTDPANSYSTEMAAVTKKEAKRLAARAVTNAVADRARPCETRSVAGDRRFSADDVRADTDVRRPTLTIPADDGRTVTRTHADVHRRTEKARRSGQRFFAAREAVEKEISDLADLFAAMSLEDTDESVRRTVSSASAAAGPPTRGTTENGEIGEPGASVSDWLQAKRTDQRDHEKYTYARRKRVRPTCA